MHSFYVFEDSFFQGGGGWGNLTVAGSLEEIHEAVYDVLRTGWNLSPAADLDIRVYQKGELTLVRDLYPHIRLEIPGLTEIRWDDEGWILGGEPLPDSDMQWVTEDLNSAEPRNRNERMWVLTDERLLRDTEYTVTVDWAGLGLPELLAPVLKEGRIELDGEERRYGFNDLLMNDDEYDYE
ncbi:hypothetical protein [Actinomadura roseirufa]|uniref:hypothetical protein n=1 Tax=Actinomadura roseirufa TaxID=2094049 RepID=UPI001041BB9F|nr:hypothetical protein [Actinomadura roseirufa]